MRYFGVLSAIAVFILLFIFSDLLDTSLLYNHGFWVFNICGLILMCFCFYFLVIPKYKVSPGQVTAMYLLSSIGIINFSCTLLGIISERTRSPQMLPKDDYSGVIIAPVVLVIAMIWGWIFDWRKNKMKVNE